MPILLVLSWLLGISVSAEPLKHKPRYERVDNGIETLWQRPTDTPKGIALLAHGCMHQAPDFWSEVGNDGWVFEHCSESYFGQCLGLPAEVRLRQAARDRGYLVIAVSGGDGQKSCWDMDRDPPRVAKAIAHVRNVEQLSEDLPIFGIGISSGGYLMGFLSRAVESGGLPGLKCIVSQIANAHAFYNRGLPTVYDHMVKDQEVARRVKEEVKALNTSGISVKVLKLHSLTVSPEYIEQCVEHDVAVEIFQALVSAKLLDEDQHLVHDARNRRWVRPVMKVAHDRIHDTLFPDQSCLAEIFNTAWSQHEASAEHVQEMFDFCETSMKNVPNVPTDSKTEL